jgi:hypothetical protein
MSSSAHSPTEQWSVRSEARTRPDCRVKPTSQLPNWITAPYLKYARCPAEDAAGRSGALFQLVTDG